MIQVYNAPSTMVRDLTLQGNFRDQGFGLNWTRLDAGRHQWQPVTEIDVPQGRGASRAASCFTVGATTASRRTCA